MSKPDAMTLGGAAAPADGADHRQAGPPRAAAEPEIFRGGVQDLGDPVEERVEFLGRPATVHPAVTADDRTTQRGVGVAAGRAGDFGLVIGVDRGAGAQNLIDNGADIAVADLKELIS